MIEVLVCEVCLILKRIKHLKEFIINLDEMVIHLNKKKSHFLTFFTMMIFLLCGSINRSIP